MTEPTPKRPRLRDLGIAPGILSPGPQNAITDVAGVRVGHETVIEGDSIRTGATAILPHAGTLFQDKVPAGFVVGNGFGKFAGATQITELGEIETPIVLTNTLSVSTATEAILDWTLAHAGNEDVRSVNAVVGETNDGVLNDIRARALTSAHIFSAIKKAGPGDVAEGNVGAGTGTTAFGWKGGIGTSSRRLSGALAGSTIGVLVQSNFGGLLQILGAPVGLALRQNNSEAALADADGSIMIVVATDLPLSDRNLTRLGRRALTGLARTGTTMSNGSGDYVLAFSTNEAVRRTLDRRRTIHAYPDVPNELMSDPFQAVIEATEEAILNSLLRAETVHGYRKTVEALPLKKTIEVLRHYGHKVKTL